ncbi:MAG: ABC transporter ATP-binding protein [Acidobacteria bacterium]|nr:ABC transporter ATP-binding protein [Acidobacteriota bacterium]
MKLIELREAGFRYTSNAEALNGITLEVQAPQIIAIAGPNGSGKSTLLDLIAGLRRLSSGKCLVLDLDAAAYSRRDFCRIVAHVPQRMPEGVPFTVEEVALTGRTPFGHGLYDSTEDLAAATSALARAGIEHLRQRPYASLSGGEQQRALLAAALCQQPQILLLDEPGAHLDPRNEASLWTLLREVRDTGCLVIVVTHHLALAARHADRVWLLDRGRLVMDAEPAVALAPSKLSQVFDVPFFGYSETNGRVFLSYGN